MLRRLRHLWKRHVALPSPKDLGRSEVNGLPSRDWTEDPDAYTWDDYEDEVRVKFPVRYRISQIFAETALAGRWIGHAGYWLRCHTYNRYHLLDLSKAESEADGYRWGYLEPSDIMFLASFLALRIYVEKGNPYDPASDSSLEELGVEPLKSQKEAYDEALFLYRWWTEGRMKEEVDSARLHEHARSLPRRSLEREQAMTTWLDFHKVIGQRPHEMLVRLAKIQETLWT